MYNMFFFQCSFSILMLYFIMDLKRLAVNYIWNFIKLYILEIRVLLNILVKDKYRFYYLFSFVKQLLYYFTQEDIKVCK